MPIFRLDKLVRDGIVSDQLKIGQTPNYRQLGSDEHKRELIRKVVEEAGEMLDVLQVGDIKGELADVFEALETLMSLCDISVEDVAEARAAKKAKVGGFSEGLYVETLGVPEGDPWIGYYRREPERYKEL